MLFPGIASLLFTSAIVWRWLSDPAGSYSVTDGRGVSMTTTYLKFAHGSVFLVTLESEHNPRIASTVGSYGKSNSVWYARIGNKASHLDLGVAGITLSEVETSKRESLKRTYPVLLKLKAWETRVTDELWRMLTET